MSFSFPSLLFHEGRTYGQPEVVLISLPQVATGLRLRLPGSFRRRAFARATSQADMLACPFGDCRDNQQICLLVHADLLMPQEALLRRGRSGRYHFSYWKCYLPEINAGYGRKGETDHGDLSLYGKDCWAQQREIHHISVCLSQWRCDEK